MRNLQNVQVRTGSGFEKVCPFPVGAIYQSTSSTSPASIYGGGWTSLTDGRFLRPQESWNNLGGENEHKLTVAEMPSHSHEQQVAVNQIHTLPAGGARLLALLLQMLYVETHCLAVRSELASQAKEKNSLIAVMLYA